LNAAIPIVIRTLVAFGVALGGGLLSALLAEPTSNCARSSAWARERFWA
jgi:predicted alpha/beta-fold hydrolase